MKKVVFFLLKGIKIVGVIAITLIILANTGNIFEAIAKNPWLTWIISCVCMLWLFGYICVELNDTQTMVYTYITMFLMMLLFISFMVNPKILAVTIIGVLAAVITGHKIRQRSLKASGGI